VTAGEMVTGVGAKLTVMRRRGPSRHSATYTKPAGKVPLWGATAAPLVVDCDVGFSELRPRGHRTGPVIADTDMATWRDIRATSQRSAQVLLSWTSLLCRHQLMSNVKRRLQDGTRPNDNALVPIATMTLTYHDCL